jgi:hypothetical protein
MADSSEPTSRESTSGGRRVAPHRQDHGGSEPGDSNGRRLAAVDVIRSAGRQFREIAGMEPQSVTALEAREDGWMVEFEVTELERIPPSTSVLASYQLELSSGGEVRSYRRVRRYQRNQVDEA